MFLFSCPIRRHDEDFAPYPLGVLLGSHHAPGAAQEPQREGILPHPEVVAPQQALTPR